MEKKQLVIFIVLGVVLFLIGGGLGIVAQKQSGSAKAKDKAVSMLSSKAVSSINVYGQIKNISGKNITLSNLGEDITIKIADSAQVYSFVDSSGGTAPAPVQQKVKFEDIKVGDIVNAILKMSSTGQIEGLSVIILPPK